MASTPPTTPITCPICKVTDANGVEVQGPAEWVEAVAQDCDTGQDVKIWAGVCSNHREHLLIRGSRV